VAHRAQGGAGSGDLGRRSPGAAHRKSKSVRREGCRGQLAAEPGTGLITDAELTKASGEEGSDAVVGEKMITRDRYHRLGAASHGAHPVASTDSDPADAGAAVKRSLITVRLNRLRPTPPDRVSSPAARLARSRTRVPSTLTALPAPSSPGLQVYKDSANGTAEARRLRPDRARHSDQTQAAATGPRRAVDDDPRARATAARCPAAARTAEFAQAYPTRSMEERGITRTATSRGRRIKLRYLGVDKNHAWLRNRCACNRSPNTGRRRTDPHRQSLGPGLTTTTAAPLDQDPGHAQTAIRAKNDHIVDQSGLTYCRRNGLVGVLPAPPQPAVQNP
jgi:hypothetical protein